MNEKSLFSGERSLYSFRAAAKSAAGRRNPSYLLATQHAPCVFFYVVALVRHFLAQRFLCRCAVKIMVAQAGQPSGWPVSNKAGIPTPVWATTLERRNSGGSCDSYLLEIVIMTMVLNAPHPEFTFIFAAVRRTDRAARPCMLRFAAKDERTARANFIRDYVLCFAGRVPVQAVAA
ncbi:host cell division inhibitor Icd-like protein [Pantoea rwandensis]|uniref:CI repressor n=1 Tax=Pantoea rwandensis TaxID=1076550 RepID=A0ABM5RHK5_9GAMM|nr:host cell division inhibitor Icd-like protein [Pantoea rwandensis]AIR85330.1 CI repressor [Pantoea rwandensis]